MSDVPVTRADLEAALAPILTRLGALEPLKALETEVHEMQRQLAQQQIDSGASNTRLLEFFAAQDRREQEAKDRAKRLYTLAKRTVGVLAGVSVAMLSGIGTVLFTRPGASLEPLKYIGASVVLACLVGAVVYVRTGFDF